MNLALSINGNNQISSSGFTYDADGEMTSDSVNNYTYTSDNAVASAGGVNYTYDADSLRVEKSSGTLYWRTYTGQVIEETNTSGGMQRDYVFFAGRRIAWKDSSGNVYYYFADAIGSTRAVTNSTGSVCFSADYYPYGQENDYVTSCSPTYKFAGYEFDSETGNYYAYARYYSPQYGRFISPDPLGGSVGNPQSLNGYSYVINNPTSLNDPLGLIAQCDMAGRSAGFGDGGGGSSTLPSCGFGGAEGGGGGGGGDGTCLVDGGEVSCGMVGVLVTAESIDTFTTCSDYMSCVLANNAQELMQVIFLQLQAASAALSLPADPNGTTANCVYGALHESGAIAKTVTFAFASDGHGNYNVVLSQWGGLLNLYLENLGMPFGARIPVDIGGHIYGWHVEDVNGNRFTTHFDYGDPNWDGAGVFEHVLEDGFLGGLFFPQSSALDPKCGGS